MKICDHQALLKCLIVLLCENLGEKICDHLYGQSQTGTSFGTLFSPRRIGIVRFSPTGRNWSNESK